MKKVIMLIVAFLLLAGVTITATRNVPQADFPANQTMQSSEDSSHKQLNRTHWNGYAY